MPACSKRDLEVVFVGSLELGSFASLQPNRCSVGFGLNSINRLSHMLVFIGST